VAQAHPAFQAVPVNQVLVAQVYQAPAQAVVPQVFQVVLADLLLAQAAQVQVPVYLVLAQKVHLAVLNQVQVLDTEFHEGDIQVPLEHSDLSHI